MFRDKKVSTLCQSPCTYIYFHGVLTLTLKCEWKLYEALMRLVYKDFNMQLLTFSLWNIKWGGFSGAKGGCISQLFVATTKYMCPVKFTKKIFFFKRFGGLQCQIKLHLCFGLWPHCFNVSLSVTKKTQGTHVSVSVEKSLPNFMRLLLLISIYPVMFRNLSTSEHCRLKIKFAL